MRGSGCYGMIKIQGGVRMKEKTRLWLVIIWLVNAVIWTGLLLTQSGTADTDLFTLRMITAILSWIVVVVHFVRWYRGKKKEQE